MDHNKLGIKSLSEIEANLALHRYGPNELGIHPFNFLRIILKEILSPLTILYLAFALIAFLLGNINESILIILIVLFSLVLNFINSFKVLKLSKDIKRRNPGVTEVIREGKIKDIKISEIVPGDIIHLNMGDMVPADSQVVYEKNLFVDESLINGESFPSKKIIKKGKIREINTLYYHTFINSGECYAKVIKTGNETAYAKLARFTEPKRIHKGFNSSLNELIWHFLIYGSLLISVLTFLLLIFNNKPFDLSLIILLLSLMISMIPEALPIINSLGLHHYEQKLSKRGVYINNIDVFEDLADIELICTDKTGTLTLNVLEVMDHDRAIDKDEFNKYLYLSSIDSSDPFDVALQDHLKEMGYKPEETLGYESRTFDPFIKTSSRKFKDFEIHKGAPEYILSKMHFENNLSLSLKVKKRTSTGERALSLIKEKDGKKEYLGTIFFQDPIKPDTKETIKNLFNKGIKLKLISGDNLNICSYVAIKTGLINDKNKCIEASSLRFDSPKILKQQLSQYDVIARADPIQKYKIIESLMSGFKLAYLGDGINDIPSIKLADVGIVVENSIDLAKFNSDIVLTHKHLDGLIEGIIESRKIFHNTEHYLSHALSINFNNFLSISILLFVLQYFPILPVQILIGNLIMDIVAVKFAYEHVSMEEIKRPSNFEINKTIKLALILGSINSILDVIFFLILKDLEPSHIQTLWFIITFVADLLLIFSVKSKGIFLKSLPSPLFIINMILAILVMLVIAIYGIPVISISAIPYGLFPIMFITPIIYFIILELAKILISSKLSFK